MLDLLPSAAIVVDFTVESPAKAKRALEIMRTEALDLPDDLQKEWKKLSYLKDVITEQIKKQKKSGRGLA